MAKRERRGPHAFQRVRVLVPTWLVGTVLGITMVERGRSRRITLDHVTVELPNGTKVDARPADVRPVQLTREALAQRRALGIRPDAPFEYHSGGRNRGRALGPNERAYAEDRQVLEAISISEHVSIADLVAGFDHCESTDGPGHDRYTLDWGISPTMRRMRLKTILARLVDEGLVEVRGRHYFTTRKGERALKRRPRRKSRSNRREKPQRVALDPTDARQAEILKLLGDDGPREVLFEQGKGGWVVVSVPDTPGAYSQGRNRADALWHLIDALKLIRRRRG